MRVWTNKNKGLGTFGRARADPWRHVAPSWTILDLSWSHLGRKDALGGAFWRPGGAQGRLLAPPRAPFDLLGRLFEGYGGSSIPKLRWEPCAEQLNMQTIYKTYTNICKNPPTP